jgi:hypothetical protein
MRSTPLILAALVVALLRLAPAAVRRMTCRGPLWPLMPKVRILVDFGWTASALRQRAAALVLGQGLGR